MLCLDLQAMDVALCMYVLETRGAVLKYVPGSRSMFSSTSIFNDLMTESCIPELCLVPRLRSRFGWQCRTFFWFACPVGQTTQGDGMLEVVMGG